MPHRRQSVTTSAPHNLIALPKSPCRWPRSTDSLVHRHHDELYTGKTRTGKNDPFPFSFPHRPYSRASQPSAIRQDQSHITVVMNIIIATQLYRNNNHELPVPPQPAEHGPRSPSPAERLLTIHLEFYRDPSPRPPIPFVLPRNCYLTPPGERILLSLNRNKISI